MSETTPDHDAATGTPAAPEPLLPRAEDESVDERNRVVDDERRSVADGRSEHGHEDDESSYPTEVEQGAAQPGPAPGV